MITLTEQIDIPAPFERFLAWADNFEEEFVKWSPLHYECELYDKSLEVGSRLRFHELVMGLDYDVKGSIVESVRENDHVKVSFLSDKKTAVITFEAWRTDEGIHFSHTEAFGSRTPLIAPLINFLIFKVLFRKKANFELIRQDMILDNDFLYDILVHNSYPDRDPKKSAASKLVL